MNSILLVSLFVFFCLGIINLIFAKEQGFASYQGQKSFHKTITALQRVNFLDHFDNYILEKNPELNKLLGGNLTIKLFIPLTLLFSFSILILGPSLSGIKFGPILGLIIFIAYSSRLIYHLLSKQRSKLFGELARILTAIRNNLSTGQSLDYAVNQSINNKNSSTISDNLANFIRTNNSNLIQSFPGWLNLIEKQYRISHLAKYSQLLALELKHNNNQEEAFINAVELIDEKQEQNKKQKNTIQITFITLDFMVLAFLGVIFFVIPGLSFSDEIKWWESQRRELVVFISGTVLWLCYLLTIFTKFWRTK